MLKTMITVLIIMFVCICGFMVVDPNVNLLSTVSGNTTGTTTSTSLTITVTGQVQNVGTYIMVSGDTMQELIEAAGGTTSLADSTCYFTSYELVDGWSYYIASTNDTGDVCSTTSVSKININSGDEDDLMSISGIGSTLSNSIIDYRNSNGNFECLEELKNVTGVGNATFEKIKDYICLS